MRAPIYLRHRHAFGRLRLGWLKTATKRIDSRMKRLPLYLDLVLYCAVLIVAAAGAGMLALDKIGDVIKDTSASQASIEVKRSYLSAADYAEYLPTLTRLNPGVGIALSPDGSAVVLMVSDEDLFPDLMMALHTLQAFKPGVAWDLIEMCAKKCPDEAVARAIVKGFTQEIRNP